MGWPPPSGPWVSGQAPGMQEKQLEVREDDVLSVDESHVVPIPSVPFSFTPFSKDVTVS